VAAFGYQAAFLGLLGLLLLAVVLYLPLLQRSG
jgi:hypothetical protein